ncbi:MAG TPA: lysine 2,3-aminomutase, partial [Stellaceae bacterium]|nr:lysine 2,3-aminomutase [Stellaceae bacterium]
MKPRILRKASDLAEAGLIAPARVAELERVAGMFELAVTPEMAALIGDSGDPIGRQFIPSVAE